MDIDNTAHQLTIPTTRLRVATLEGILKEFSTEKLHVHEIHQILLFKSGISLLLDEQKKQPLFNNMTAFIPAGCPHRSVVLGRQVEYKSLYLEKNLFQASPENIRIFNMSELGIALFKKIDIPFFEETPKGDSTQLNEACLNLFLKVLAEDISKKSALARLPVPTLGQNMTIIRHLEKQYRGKIKLHDFANLLPYTVRHISRMFKADLKISIFEYLKIYRILQASIALETTDTTITEIAYACGYNSISVFFKDFGQIFSLTPKQFRARFVN